MMSVGSHRTPEREREGEKERMGRVSPVSLPHFSGDKLHMLHIFVCMHLLGSYRQNEEF